MAGLPTGFQRSSQFFGREVAMKQVIFSVLVLFLLSGTSAFAGGKTQSTESPESIVTCATGSGNGVEMRTVPVNFNLSECDYAEDCATCVTSLEAQGCRVIDVVVTHPAYLATSTTFLISCVEP